MPILAKTGGWPTNGDGAVIPWCAGSVGTAARISSKNADTSNKIARIEVMKKFYLHKNNLHLLGV